MNENKKKLVSLSIAIFVLLLIVVGATYAYFAAQIDSGSQADVTITAESVDSLTFTTGDPISFSITQDNLKLGGTDRSGSTTATASLIAGKDSNASYDYYVYLDISNNEFIYTTKDKKPELLLKVTGPNNTAVTNIKGLTYNATLGGFDITNVDGLIKIAENYNIATTSNETQNWTAEIIFKNLETNQVENAGKSFKAELKIQNNKIAEILADVCSEGDNLANCIKMLENSSMYNYSGLIHHNGANEYDANDDSYRYTGGDYKISSKYIESYSGINGIVYECFNSDNIKGLCVADEMEFFSNPHEALEFAETKRYLEKGNINNYVCFGSDAEICPEDNLYRIIGVFGNQVKLIKYDYINSNILGSDGDYSTNTYDTSQNIYYMGNLTSINKYYWNYNSTGAASNDWETSLLNTTNLNTNYLNNIGSKWANMIAETTWYIGGTNSISAPVKTFHNEELLKVTTQKSKVGLMYPSDYGYATVQSKWNQTINASSYNLFKFDNWMYMGATEWTMSPYIRDSRNVQYLQAGGYIVYGSILMGNTAVVRPTFYLTSSIKYVSGDGTQNSPFRLSL